MCRERLVLYEPLTFPARDALPRVLRLYEGFQPVALQPLRTVSVLGGASFLAEISVRSPRKSIDFIIPQKKNLDQCILKANFFNFRNRSTGFEVSG